MTRLFGLALAGGRGSRMGGVDKARLLVGGRTMLERTMGALSRASRIAIAGGDRIGRADASGLTVLADPRPGLGPLGGLAAGLAWAEAGGADLLLTAPIDTPFLTPAAYDPLIAAMTADATLDAAVAAADGRAHWLTACWRPRLADRARRQLTGGGRAVAGLLDDQPWIAVDTPTPANQFMNVNTSADLDAANALAANEGGASQ